MADHPLVAELRRALKALSGNSQWDSGADWAERSLGACDNATMKAILEDNRRGGDIHARASAGPPPKATSQQNEEPQKPYTYGWTEAAPLPRPAGIEHVDALCDMQDKLDAAERANRMGLSYSEWQKLSEQDIAARKAQQAKKAEVKK
jgi:hypothetical protein